MATSTSSGSKRKGEPEELGANKKKYRMDKEEASEILQKLISQLEDVIDLYRNKYPNDLWYRYLVEHRKLLFFLLKDEELNLIQLSLRKELGPLSRKGVSDETDVKVKLDDLDAALLKAIKKSRSLPAPSAYCMGGNYRYAQSHSQNAVRDGRTGTAPLALELLHGSFRIFTYWSFINPYPLPGSSIKDQRSINKESFINVYQAANQLLLSMPRLYSSHDDCLFDFKKALLLAFPENDQYQWCHNAPPEQDLDITRSKSGYKVDLVYRYRETRVPLIFVEVKLELGEGGNPFWQNHRLYQSYTKLNDISRHNGAPIFLVQLCGMTFLHYDFHFVKFYL